MKFICSKLTSVSIGLESSIQELRFPLVKMFVCALNPGRLISSAERDDSGEKFPSLRFLSLADHDVVTLFVSEASDVIEAEEDIYSNSGMESLMMIISF
ncbi:hypothetical protein TNCT_197181 [Trichonephila clavata]|uniref:Uncharacterized protein n=1 Tax=Trichonephila clavata TaxID=2740835 RepID=A0A8X6ISY8_TRICU|nr:hypothetical protein TNCT_197181 [Trichonephila clavata]